MSDTRETSPYGTDPNQFGVLTRPPGDSLVPVVVLVHGGFWRSAYGLSLMDALAEEVVRRGWAAWNIEYRRLGQDGGGWPGTFEDVSTAIDHLLTFADAHALDLTRVATVGHSAGGHLAAWLATRAGLPADAPGASPAVRPIAVVSQAGVLDLIRSSDASLGGGVTDVLMGGRPTEVPERYALASPQARVPLGVPVRCVHGRQDDIVPIAQSEGFVAAAVAAGDPSGVAGTALAPFAGDHFAVLDPAHESWTGSATWLAERFGA